MFRTTRIVFSSVLALAGAQLALPASAPAAARPVFGRAAAPPPPPTFSYVVLPTPAPPAGYRCTQAWADAISPRGAILGHVRCRRPVDSGSVINLALWPGGAPVRVGGPLPDTTFFGISQLTQSGVAFVMFAPPSSHHSHAYRYTIAVNGSYRRVALARALRAGRENAHGTLAVQLNTSRAGTLQPPGRYTDISGGRTSASVGIDDAGDVAGNLGSSPSNYQAFAYHSGRLLPLPLDPGFTQSSVVRITQNGFIVASEYSAGGGPTKIIVWDTSGRVVTRIGCPGSSNLLPLAANDRLDVTGLYGRLLDTPFIYLFKERTCLVGTQFLPSTLMRPVILDINDDRQMVGIASRAGAVNVIPIEVMPNSGLR
jgi:hypothetical protein